MSGWDITGYSSQICAEPVKFSSSGHVKTVKLYKTLCFG